MNPLFQRLALITGAAALDALSRVKVCVFGLGGVGSWCAEALVRSGVGSITVVDSDAVCVTNINRQTQATTKTVGAPKALALRDLLLEINPRCAVSAVVDVFNGENAGKYALGNYDFVIDAIDSLGCKLDLIETCAKLGVRFFSSMGMAQKLDPTQIRVADLWETQRCPLARLVRQGLRKRGFSAPLTVVYSPERLPLHREIGVACGSAHCLCPRPCGESAGGTKEWCSTKKVINGSAVMVTAAAGMALASLVVRGVCGGREDLLRGSFPG